MKVKFRQNWFGPNGSRFRRDGVYDVPDEWKARLPKSVTVIEEAPVVEPEPEPTPEPEVVAVEDEKPLTKVKADIKL